MSAVYAFLNSFQNPITSRYDIGPQVATSGLWKVHSATRRTTNQAVAVFIFEKKVLEAGASGQRSGLRERGGSRGDTERVYEALKKEASNLARLRHPSLLEVVEPMTESRSAIAFATEPILACLSDLVGSGYREDGGGYANMSNTASGEEFVLDDLEIQKGLSQVGKGLQFCHADAKIVHTNLVPEAIFVNAKGDWKIGGFGHSIYLSADTKQDIDYDYNEFVPAAVQRNLDYLAPEFVLDHQLATSNDMFSLGCLIWTIYSNQGSKGRGNPTLLNTHHNLRTYEKKLSALPSLLQNTASTEAFGAHIQEILTRLLTHHPSSRLTVAQFQSSKYFENILVNTMKYLESFPEKTREEKAAFMKGLTRILPQFPERVLIRKILPSLIEELKDHQLLPFTLPNMFFVAKKITSDEFTAKVLPGLKPVFLVRDPPQNMLTLLSEVDSMKSLVSREVFRDDIMPLVYAALETPVPQVQEKALRVTPTICESLDYTTVKTALFPRIQQLFVQTTVLSVKVSTLICFHSMLKTLDKFTMQQTLVPLLKNIKTKEPAVMLATLAVYDEMGKHLDKEIIATEILPQLWRMSFGPLLKLEQFKKFMKTIRELSARVEEQHMRYLMEMKGLEEQQKALETKMPFSVENEVAQVSDNAFDFEKLIGTTTIGENKDIEGDLFGSIGNGGPVVMATRNGTSMETLKAVTANTSNSANGSTVLATSTFAIKSPSPAPITPSTTTTTNSNATAWSSFTSAPPLPPPTTTTSTNLTKPIPTLPQPLQSSIIPPLQPAPSFSQQQSFSQSIGSTSAQNAKSVSPPNYNALRSLTPDLPINLPNLSSNFNTSLLPSASPTPVTISGGILAPISLTPAKAPSSGTAATGKRNQGLDDFDPFR